MNFKKTVLMVPMLAMMASCQEVYPSVDQMTGIIDETFTRTSFVEEGIKLKTNWEYGDYIIVKSARNNTDGISDESGNATIDDESDRGYSYITEYIEENKALFAIMDESEPDAPYIGYYPREISENVLPNSQIYKADGPYQAPMMAKAPTMYLLFKPICGVIEVKLSTSLENAVVKKIVLSANQSLCGSFTVGDDYVAIVRGEQELTLNCGKGVELGTEPKSFWFSVPQGTFTGVKLEMTTTDGRTQTFTFDENASIEVVRAEITTCPVNVTLLNEKKTAESATLPTGLEFNRFVKKIANPGTVFASIEPQTPDSNVKAIRFETENSSTEGLNINTAGSTPIYASFDAQSGVVTISTPAKELRLHKDCTGMFRYLTALTEVDLSPVVTDDICNMNYMFYYCESLTNFDMSAIYSANVQDLDNCFSHCYSLESIDMSSFKSEKVTNIRSCFNRCYNLQGKIDLSGIKSDNVKYLGYAFISCRKVTSVDIRNINPAATAENMTYMFFNMPCLEEIYVHDNFIPTDKVSAGNLFAGSAETHADRTASVPGKLTIHCSQTAADWMAITTLRWVNSGYKTNVAIPVTFIDNGTGKAITATWAAN